MLRQRLQFRTSAAIRVGQVLVALIALALIWYGLMALLLAVKVSPRTVNDLSGYRTLFDDLSGTKAGDISGLARAIAAAAGLLAFVVFGLLALRAFPRPTLARGDLDLDESERGSLVVQPRAVERIAETVAQRHPAVAAATGRFGHDALDLLLTVRRPRQLPDTLRSVQKDVREALATHDLPAVPVNVTLSGIDRSTRRDLR